MENLKFNEPSDFDDQKDSVEVSIHKKLDELITLLSDNTLDNNSLQSLQQKFDDALHTSAGSTGIQPYVKGRRNNGLTEQADADLGQLLFIDKLDRRTQRKYSVYQTTSMIIRLLIATLLILLGFGMIIMPAPPYFEMFTLFYLNPNDGVTIMDVISLIVAFAGVYLLVGSIAKYKRGK